ncbi:DUF4157 domain-containing protein [Ophiocordyceps camponoti-floridani]|uniref:DUF4157 domain-containing protein n=1 Tax=Ophiocordyceps camponoti-floridani TaxID=2030778 RepID=A0A8H4Q0L5_9HYPO|nr:DUF4157 domain-containing protein [Ophiocordyceps camponoti-floridani]
MGIKYPPAWINQHPVVPGWPVDILNTRTGIYTGSYGQVFQQESDTGIVTSAKDLEDSNQETVQLSASPNGGVILAGCNGWVFSLKPGDLQERWKTRLPCDRGGITTVFYTLRGIYAAVWGHLYRLDMADGRVEANNDLSGLGHGEVRLALTADLECLAVGIRGTALCLDPTTLDTKWKQPLRRWDVVSVVGGQDFIYAGTNGYIYALRQQDGKETARNDLPQLGSYEARMALDDERPILYAGLKGYALAMHTSDLEYIYRVQLPFRSDDLTTVLDGIKVAYFSNNGQVFELDDMGSILSSVDLRSYDSQAASLSAHNLEGEYTLAVGLAGRSFGFDLGRSFEPLDQMGRGFSRAWMPDITNMTAWRHYNPALVSGTSLLQGIESETGKLVAMTLKSRQSHYLETDGSVYVWTVAPHSGVVVRLLDEGTRWRRWSPEAVEKEAVKGYCAGMMRVTDRGFKLLFRENEAERRCVELAEWAWPLAFGVMAEGELVS